MENIRKQSEIAQNSKPHSSRQEPSRGNDKNPLLNRLSEEDAPAHEWYRFVLSFPPHLVRDYLKKFGIDNRHKVLDPFCGTGTTLVECKKLGIESIGVEANPMTFFASSVKTDWSIDPHELHRHAKQIAERARIILESGGFSDTGLPLFAKKKLNQEKLKTLPPDSMKLLLADSISPVPLHKTLILLDGIHAGDDNPFRRYELLGLARSTVENASNLHFGPEVGVGKKKMDAPVVGGWLNNIEKMTEHLVQLQHQRNVNTTVFNADSRKILDLLPPGSIDVVITSPPYPNEKDYTRTTRLESVILGFIKNKKDLRDLKKTMVRSNTRGVYKEDDDDRWIKDHPEIHRIAEEIEKRRIELGKTSGFERMYHRVTKLYFGGMARHLSELRNILKPGARLAYVVGDQASYLRVMIRTGEIVARIADSLGYQVLGIDLFRCRLSTATRQYLNEEVVLLKWPERNSN